MPIRNHRTRTCYRPRQNVTITAAFGDLGGYGLLDRHCYGGAALNPYSRQLRRHLWATMIHTDLNMVGNTGDWDTEVTAEISRQTDFVLCADYSALTPVIVPKAVATPSEAAPCQSSNEGPGNAWFTFYQPRWTRKLAHHLQKNLTLYASDMVVTENPPEFQDFIFELGVGAGMRKAYAYMMGDRNSVINPSLYYEWPSGQALPGQKAAQPAPAINSTFSGVTLQSERIRNPLHGFYFGRALGSAFNQAAIPFNECKLTWRTPHLHEVLAFDTFGVQMPYTRDGATYPWYVFAVPGGENVDNCPVHSFLDGGIVPKLLHVVMGTTQVVLTNFDRKFITSALQHEALIEQVQIHPCQTWKMGENPTARLELRFGQQVKYMLAAVKNLSAPGEAAIYSLFTPKAGNLLEQEAKRGPIIVLDDPDRDANPIGHITVRYENQPRACDNTTFFAGIEAFHGAEYCPIGEKFGFNLIRYSHRMLSTQPDLSTNFTKMASIQVDLEQSDEAAELFNHCGDEFGPRRRLEFRTVFMAVNMTILLSSMGAAGFVFS